MAIDLVELSNLAWALIDPAGVHEREERLWVAALRNDWSPPQSVDELEARLDETVSAPRPSVDPGLLALVAAVIGFLAAHSERRRFDEAVLRDSLFASFWATGVPEEIEHVLEEGVNSHARAHGVAHGLRHFHARPEARPVR
jgi:hypothetical protein